ncbi:WG containing repeat-containing protein [Flavobacterium chilense]|uniref:WG containing repeat-containing protein n=2 Tax=Flavobacterium chilense TaxID=946677 RepID=A0A1M6YRK9_9FLAO|nr:WG containing repeat-containing protein [Flavobacterium chilense]
MLFFYTYFISFDVCYLLKVRIMKMFRIFLLLFPLLSICQPKFNPIREQLTTSKKYEYVYNFENNYAAFRTFKGKMGLIDSTGNVVIKPNYEFINNKPELKNLYEAGISIHKKYKRGFIDLKSNIRIPFEYEDVYYFGNGLIRVSKNNKTGVLDTLNRIVLPLKFDYIMAQDGILFVQTINTIDLFDSTGKQITRFKAKDIDYFKDHRAIVTLQNSTKLIIDNQGKVVLSPVKNHQFEKVINSDSFLIRNTLTNKKGIINSLGEYEIECKYDDIITDKSIYIVKNKLKYGLVTPKDSVLKPLIYDAIYAANYNDDTLFKNQFLAKKGDLEGIIDPFSEKDIIPCQYKNIQTFSNFYVVTNSNDKNGLFSEKGEVVIDENYDFYAIAQNKIFATKNDKKYLLTILENTYSEIEIPVDEFARKKLFYNGFIKSKYQIFKTGNQFGVMSNQNKIVIPCEFDAIENIYTSSEFVVKKNNKYGVVNTKNEVLLPVKYDSYNIIKESIKFENKGQKEIKHYAVNFSQDTE